MEILNPKTDKFRIQKLLADKSVLVVDDYAGQLEELKALRKTAKGEGLWVYFPWRKCIVHILDEKNYTEVRTSRNKNLITAEEQKKFARVKIGFAGLNVGNPGAVCVALEGGGNYMKMADFDPLSLSNLNRFRAGLPDLGVNKAELTARQVYEINPFAQIKVFEKGIKLGLEEEFLLKPKIDILVEEIDNLQLKVKLREKAKKHKIPVVMVTGNASGLVLDVERYDLDKNLPILSGHLKKDVIMRIEGMEKLKTKEKVMLMRDFMGAEVLHPRLVKSFEEVGTKLAGIPQLAEASFLRGSVLANVVRRIALGDKIKSGRYFINIDELC